MTTDAVVAEDLGLAWAETQFASAELCEIDDEGICPGEAVAVAVFEGCDCGPGVFLVCAEHRDELEAAKGRCLICCSVCGVVWRLLRMEPLR
jgi:hypothetical protein